MVDEARVLRLLRSLTDDLDVLSVAAGTPEQARTDPLWLRGVKYTLITAVEACVDVAQHVCAAEEWGPPRDNGDAVRLLGERGVVDADLADRVRRAVGLRNVLVHGYVSVDDRIVLARLHDPSDLRRYAQQVNAWLDGLEPSEPA